MKPLAELARRHAIADEYEDVDSRVQVAPEATL